MSPSTTVHAASRAERVDLGLRYVVGIVCAGSAGVHAGQVPGHLAESPALAVAFAAVAALLAAMALAVRRPGPEPWAPLAAAALLAAVAFGYVLSRTTGVPWLIPAPEQFDPVGALMSTAEVLGAAAALLMTRRKESQ